MSFITTGLRELTLKLRRQRTRLALRHEQRALQKAEITLGREGTSEAASFPEVRAEIVALRKLEHEQKEFAVRIAKIEEGLKQIDQQRQENSRAQSEALAQLEEERRPLLQRRDAAKAEAELRGKDLSALEQRIQAHEAADQGLLKRLSALESAEVPPPDRDVQLERLAQERVRLPNEKAEMVQERQGQAESYRGAREKLAAEEATVAAADKRIAKAREEFEARDRALNESSRTQKEEVRAERQQHQTVEEKKNPAYLNIGRHLANAGIAPPNAPQLLSLVQRHRAAVDRHTEHKLELGEISRHIDKQELRKFYFAGFSILCLVAVVLPLAMQSPAKRDWLPEDTGALFSVDPGALVHNEIAQRWQKEQPEVWRKVFAGIVGAAAQTPALDLVRDAGRITRASVVGNDGQPRDYVLVEASSDIGPVLSTISQDKTFSKSTVSGLVVWERPNVTVARVGPRTLAVGPLYEVDQLVQVRLGTEPDLKVDDPLSLEFQALESESTLRLAARRPADLPRIFGPIFPQELLTSARLLGFAIVLKNPSQAHLFVRAENEAAAKDLEARFNNETARWLTLPGSDFVLSTLPPQVKQSGANLDLHFEVPEGAARLLLQRLARVQPTPLPNE